VVGSSYTTVSGGLAHGVYVPQAWSATLKNGALNTWALVLAAELNETPLRFNNVCIHFGVASFGGIQIFTICVLKTKI
jgi:hypothetical protein